MLAKFSVSNFKGFKDEITFSLQDINGYSFNAECIKNGLVNNALIYGYNASGKSNLGLAIFDIISHLTDKQKGVEHYAFYLNAESSSNFASFSYEFKFDGHKVVYSYEKSDYQTLLKESFWIDDELVAQLDRREDKDAIIKLPGTENLKRTLTTPNLSLLKYIRHNTELSSSTLNDCFKQFFDFVEHMLFFRSLQDNTYLGLEIGRRVLISDIIEKNQVAEFQSFLNEAGLNYKLIVVKESEEETIAIDFGDKTIALNLIASSGTRSLILFYFWFQRLKEAQVSFLYIDEFDAFYHHELSAFILKKLKDASLQFVLTTHNTTIMTNDLLRPDCYFLLKDGKIQSLSRSTNKELREAHNIEKMYKAGTFHE